MDNLFDLGGFREAFNSNKYRFGGCACKRRSVLAEQQHDEWKQYVGRWLDGWARRLLDADPSYCLNWGGHLDRSSEAEVIGEARHLYSGANVEDFDIVSCRHHASLYPLIFE